MKTLSLEELYNKIMSSDELKKEYFAAANDGRIAEFLGAHDCRATLEELQEFLTDPKKLPQGEIADDELDAVSGGGCYSNGYRVVMPNATCASWQCTSCYTKLDSPAVTCPNCHMPTVCAFCQHSKFKSMLLTCRK